MWCGEYVVYKQLFKHITYLYGIFANMGRVNSRIYYFFTYVYVSQFHKRSLSVNNCFKNEKNA